MTRLVPALSGAALGVLIGVAALAGVPALAAALLLATVAIASGWATLLNLPTPRGSTAVIALGGAVAVTVAALTDDPPYLRWLPGVLAVTLLVEFGHQLLRRDMRPRLVESVTGVVSALVVVGFGAGWLGALHDDGGTGVVLVGAASAVAAAVALGLPWPQRVTGPAAVAGGLTIGGLVGALLPDERALPAALVGALVGVVAATLDRLLAHLPTSVRPTASVSMGVAPVVASGMVVYTLGRLVS
ncbi:MAG: hypothetical protein ACLGIV_11095 [Actinomycetes bacterium]